GGGVGPPCSIRDLSLRIPDGKTMVVLGPSGCGKTTLLKIIAGLIPPDSGHVRFDDVDAKDVPPGHRRIGMVFQSYALYPHVTSRSNVLSYFMFRRKTPELDAVKRAKYQRTSELMGVDLEHLLDRKPPRLSGAEETRCYNRKILLRQFDITTVYVTHDHHEALILADLIAVMDRGRIEQVGTPQQIYEEPRTLFVAGFLNIHMGGPPISVLPAAQVPGVQAPDGA